MNNLDHLLSLATRGGHRGASGGEQQARAVVDCLLENFIGLDGNAQAGILELVQSMHENPWETRNKIAHRIEPF